MLRFLKTGGGAGAFILLPCCPGGGEPICKPEALWRGLDVEAAAAGISCEWLEFRGSGVGASDGIISGVSRFARQVPIY